MPELRQRNDLRRTPITGMDTDGPTDLSTVKIDTSLPPAQRMRDYLEQIKTPDCFLCGKTPVRVCYQADGVELSQALLRYFSGLQHG